VIEALDMLKPDPEDAKLGKLVDFSQNGKSESKVNREGSFYLVPPVKAPRRWMPYDGKGQFKRVERKQSNFPAFTLCAPRTEAKWKPSADFDLDTKSSNYSGQLNQYWIPDYCISSKVFTREIQYYLGPEASVRSHRRSVSETT